MIELSGFNTLLFLARWLFIGLIYLALFVVLFAVRRELVAAIRGGRRSPARPTADLAPGRLRVLAAGSDRALKIGQVLPLALDTSIGAEPENDLVLRDQFVSGQHARLRWDGAVWLIEDLGSKNGTQVNQAAVFPNRPLRVPPGGQINIGDIRLELIDE